jgi:hypothetical protein
MNEEQIWLTTWFLGFDCGPPGASLTAIPVWICDGLDGEGIEPVYNVSRETASRVRDVCRQGDHPYQVVEEAAALLHYEAQASYPGQYQGQQVEQCSMDGSCRTPVADAGVWQTSWIPPASLPLMIVQPPPYRPEMRRQLQRQTTL